MSISPPVGQSDDVTQAEGQTEQPYGTWAISKTQSEPIPHCGRARRLSFQQKGLSRRRGALKLTVSCDEIRTLRRLFGYRTVEVLSTLMIAFCDDRKRGERSYDKHRCKNGHAERVDRTPAELT